MVRFVLTIKSKFIVIIWIKVKELTVSIYQSTVIYEDENFFYDIACKH